MLTVESKKVDPDRIYVSIQVIKPAVVVAEHLARRGLGIWIDNNPDSPELRIINGDPAGRKLFNSIASTPEFLAMVHASNGGLRRMDLTLCRWDTDTQARLLAASAMVGHHELLRMSCLYNDLKNACPKDPNRNFRRFLERSLELEVMAEARKEQAKTLLTDRPMLTMEEGVNLLIVLSNQMIDRQAHP